MKLADTRAERDLQDSLAEIFSIIVTLDELERAFLKDAIPEADYTEICERSLKQYKSLTSDEVVAKAFVGLEEFKAEWDVCTIHSSPLFYVLHLFHTYKKVADVLSGHSSRYRVQQSA